MAETDLLGEALGIFERLFDEALAAGEPDRSAMTVATATPDGRPSARTVLLKAYDARGFVFYTLLFHWPRVRDGVQVRIEGAVEQVSEMEADAYFASRPRTSQLGAWASRQSEPLDARATFEARLKQLEEEFAGGEIPRPPRWTGFRVRPERMEFWYGAQYRLHERWVYVLDAGRRGVKRMLYP